jgi:hypothetical protein
MMQVPAYAGPSFLQNGYHRVSGTGAPGTSPCRHWAQKGFCQLGTQCLFSHLGIPGADNKVRSSDGSCRHWARGECAQGTDCKFSHEGPQGEKKEKLDVNGQKLESGGVCRHFAQRGVCNLGYSCHFSHVPEQHKSDEVCRHWQKGICKLAVHCKFKHGNPTNANTNSSTAQNSSTASTQSTFSSDNAL